LPHRVLLLGNDITNDLSLAFFGSDSATKVVGTGKVDAESLSKRRLEGSRWRGYLLTMEFECCFGTFVLLSWTRNEYSMASIDPILAHQSHAAGVRRASGFVVC
jgi:hypothetical protein